MQNGKSISLSLFPWPFQESDKETLSRLISEKRSYQEKLDDTIVIFLASYFFKRF